MSEQYPGSVERSSESDSDSSPEGSSSKKKKTLALGEKAATTLIEVPREIKQPDRIKSLFERRSPLELLGGEKSQRVETDRLEHKKIILGTGNTATHVKPAGVEAIGQTNPLAPESKDATKEPAESATNETTKKSVEADTQVPLESLSTAEEHEAVARYAEASKAELAAVPEGEPVTEARVAEIAAQTVLLDAIEAKLATNPEKSVADIAAEAEAEVSQEIAQAADQAAELLESENEIASEDVPESDLPAEGELPIHNADADESIVLHPTPGTPATASGSGSGGGSVPPRSGSGAGSGPMPPVGPPSGPYGTPGATPPFGPGGPGNPGGPGVYPGGLGFTGAVPAGVAFNAAPTATQPIEVQDITAERRAMVQGLLVGGIVGYFIGRRRGRIKTEKRLMPIQKKLEKQVTALHKTVAESEQAVRKLARERSEALAASKVAQVRFAEQLTAQRQEAQIPSPRQETVGRPVASQQVEAARDKRVVKPAAERFSGGIVEAPAIVLAAAALLRPERRRVESNKSAESGKPVDFTKAVEAYSPQELDNAAEKIKIDGTSLKELSRAHHLDERAVRRVVGEFIQGGNVKEALSREIIQKELQYERDPKLRKSAGGGSGTGGGASAASVSESEKPNNGDLKDGSSGAATVQKSTGKKPTPNEATLQALRKQQMTQVAVASATVLVIVAAIVAALTI